MRHTARNIPTAPAHSQHRFRVLTRVRQFNAKVILSIDAMEKSLVIMKLSGRGTPYHSTAGARPRGPGQRSAITFAVIRAAASEAR
jgi:hypothetical protein